MFILVKIIKKYFVNFTFHLRKKTEETYSYSIAERLKIYGFILTYEVILTSFPFSLDTVSFHG